MCWHWIKKKTRVLARFRGWIQGCATLLTNIHLPNFKKGRCIRARKYVTVRAELLFFRVPARRSCHYLHRRAFQAVVGSSRIPLKFSYYITGILILIGVLLRAASSLRVPLPLRVVSGTAALQDSLAQRFRQKRLKLSLRYLVRRSAGDGGSAADACDQSARHKTFFCKYLPAGRRAGGTFRCP